METEQQLMTVYIHVEKDDRENKPVLFNQDVSGFLDYVFLGSDDVLVNVPIVDVNQAKIDKLELEAEDIKAEYHVRLKRIEERIQSLKAIEFKGEYYD